VVRVGERSAHPSADLPRMALRLFSAAAGDGTFYEGPPLQEQKGQSEVLAVHSRFQEEQYYRCHVLRMHARTGPYPSINGRAQAVACLERK
jgi:hypothetical protein